jgi:hypothetical protein
VGHTDITGDEFGSIFAESIQGLHRQKPLGVTDVTWNGCSWSIKTVKVAKPHNHKQIRLITGRNSPTYSYGISDPLKNISKTGEAVLNIWNERVNQSLNNRDDLRVIVLVRNMSSLEFTLFEYEAVRYPAGNYSWQCNKHGNLEGIDLSTKKHCFTWQPHGSQFTIIETIPGSAYKFRIKKHPDILKLQQVLDLIQFDESWIEKVK